jgi:hypothetical protein
LVKCSSSGTSSIVGIGCEGLEAAILKYEKSLFECENEEGSIKRGGREENGKVIKVGVMRARSGFGGEASQR